MVRHFLIDSIFVTQQFNGYPFHTFSLFLESTDFIGGAYSFTLQPAEQQTTISIPITDDITVEQSEEQFSVSLSVQPQTGVSIGNSEASVTIVDNDSELLCDTLPLHTELGIKS